MNTKFVGTALTLPLLAACSSCPPPKAEEVPGAIENISFMGAHQDERCSKGCRYVSVPDTWFLNVCDKDKNCRVVTITHAPWDWQTEGRKVIIHWRTGCSWQGQFWFIASFDP